MIYYLDAIVSIMKSLLFLILALFAYLTYRHFSAVSRVKFYQEQGMSPIPEYDKFIVGSIGNLMRFTKERKEKPPGTVKHIIQFFLD